MASILFNEQRFRDQFPAFSNSVLYPEAMLQGTWTSVTFVFSDDDQGIENNPQRTRLLDLALAHWLHVASMTAKGQNTSVVNSATVDKVSVTAEPPKAKTHFQQWLMASPYGQEIRMIMKAATSAGVYIGGSNERASFRRAGGRFR